MSKPVRERTLRRAAERQARKAADKAARQQPYIPVIPTTPAPPPPVSPEPPTSEARAHANRTNAAKHNGASQRLIVAGERLEDFEALLANLIRQYEPRTQEEHSLVEDLAHGRWFLWRRRRAFIAIEADVYNTQPDQAQWTEAEFKRLALAERYRTQAERAYNRALKNVENFSKDRLKTQRLEATHHLAVQRLELQKAKHELAVAKANLRSAKNAVSSPQRTESHPPSPPPSTQIPSERNYFTA
jgi:hypothetical protein